MTLVHVLACIISINFENTLFVSRLLDFTSATGYEHVDLDSCLLSERPKLALHGEDSELPPEPQPLPSPVRRAFFNSMVQVQSEKKSTTQRTLKWGPRDKAAGAHRSHEHTEGRAGAAQGASLSRGSPSGCQSTEKTGAAREAGRRERHAASPIHPPASQHCLPLAGRTSWKPLSKGIWESYRVTPVMGSRGASGMAL